MDELTETSVGLRVIGHHDLGGYGDGMQVLREGDALYVGHFGPSGMGTSILDASDPTSLRLVEQWPAPQGSHTHKVQVADGLLLVNQERFRGGDPYAAGIAVYSLDDPFAPRPIGYFRSTGYGVHRMVWTGGDYAYVSAIPEGFNDRMFVIVDMRDPEHPVEAGRWWWPGQHTAAGEEPTWPEGKRFAAHHGLLDGDIAYVGYDDAGLVVLDLSDVSAPKQLATLSWDGVASTHTCLPLPGRGVVVATDEETKDRVANGERRIRTIDVSDPTAPVVLGVMPSPGPEFPQKGLRFGPHNLHENRPGSYRSAEIVLATYFNAGVRVYDVSDAAAPAEIASWVPVTPEGQEAPQINDLFVDREGLIYVTDRVTGGVYVLQPEEDLLARMRAVQLD